MTLRPCSSRPQRRACICRKSRDLHQGETCCLRPRLVSPLLIWQRFVDSWLPWSHIVLSNFKRWALDIFHGVSAAHLQAYLDEFCYRLNRRNQRPTSSAIFLTAVCFTRNPRHMPCLQPPERRGWAGVPIHAAIRRFSLISPPSLAARATSPSVSLATGWGMGVPRNSRRWLRVLMSRELS
jgi:hypothetical protein